MPEGASTTARPPGRLRSRLIAGVVDQAAYSLQNFAVAFTALKQLDLADLGSFSLAMTTVLLGVPTLRALVSEPLTIRFAARPQELREAVGEAAGTASTIGLVAGFVGLCVGSALSGELGQLFLSASLVAAPILLQDAWRSGLFAAHRTWSAAVNDAVVLLGTAAALGCVWLAGSISGASLMLCWGAGALCGAILGAFQLGVLPQLSATRRWLGRHRDLGLPLAGSVLAQQSMGRLSLVVVTVVGGISELGLLNTATTVLTPVNTVIAATYSFAVPDAARRLSKSLQDMRGFTFALSLALSTITIALVVVLMVIPGSWGEAIAGRNWEHAHGLLVPVGLSVLGVAFSQGARTGLRALQRPRAVLGLTLGLGAVLLASTTVGTLAGGGAGAAWGFGIASMLGQPAWMWTYRRACRQALSSVPQAAV